MLGQELPHSLRRLLGVGETGEYCKAALSASLIWAELIHGLEEFVPPEDQHGIECTVADSALTGTILQGSCWWALLGPTTLTAFVRMQMSHNGMVSLGSLGGRGWSPTWSTTIPPHQKLPLTCHQQNPLWIFLTLLYLLPILLGGKKWESTRDGAAFVKESNPQA